MELKARVSILVGVAFLLVVIAAAVPLRVMSGMVEAIDQIDERSVKFAALHSTAAQVQAEAWRTGWMLQQGVDPAEAMEGWSRTVGDASQAAWMTRGLLPEEVQATAIETIDRASRGIVQPDEWDEQVAGILAPAVASQLSRMAIGLRSENVRQLDEIVDRFSGVRQVVPAVTFVSLAMALLVMGGVGRWLLRPVGGLLEAAGEWSRGNLAIRARVYRRDELGRLAEAMNRMAEELASAQARLAEAQRLATIGEMTAAISHNIRNPLAGIRSAAQLLQRRCGDEEAQLAGGVVEAVDRLERWMRNLLQLDSTEPGTEVFRPISMAEALTGAVRVVAPVAAGRRVRIEEAVSAPSASAWGDSGLLEQALVAILSNAVDASQPDGVVAVWVKGGRLHDRRAWEIGIRDEGEGIPPELQNRVFDPYFSTKEAGLGLGLAGAQRIVRRMNGIIEVDIGPDIGGGQFRVLLPAVDDGDGDGEEATD